MRMDGKFLWVTCLVMSLIDAFHNSVPPQFAVVSVARVFNGGCYSDDIVVGNESYVARVARVGSVVARHEVVVVAECVPLHQAVANSYAMVLPVDVDALARFPFYEFAV